MDDEIRTAIKAAKSSLTGGGDREEIIRQITAVTERIKEMIFKEERILFPVALESLSEDEWLGVEEGSDEIGYCLTQPQEKWQRQTIGGARDQQAAIAGAAGAVRLETGILTPTEIAAILNHLPGDITFIDQNDTVKYFSQGRDRIFARTKAVIGRKVQDCHPPASAHIVESLLADFRAGKKEHEDFWLNLGDRLVYIRYFAVRGPEGEYLGTLEFTQNIKPIQALTGEKRLVED